MAQYRDYLPSQKSWIHDLARAEIHPEGDKMPELARGFDPQQLVEESTVEFLTELRVSFEESVKVFNGYSENGARFPEIKIYGVAQSAADFMLFRNQVKLVIANVAHGIIQFSFSNHSRTAMSFDGLDHAGSAQAPATKTQELTAQIGPFREIYWTFQNERVKPERVAKFYFAEFAGMTRDQRRSKSNNQALLDQIKTILQEKGLDF